MCTVHRLPLRSPVVEVVRATQHACGLRRVCWSRYVAAQCVVQGGCSFFNRGANMYPPFIVCSVRLASSKVRSACGDPSARAISSLAQSIEARLLCYCTSSRGCAHNHERTARTRMKGRQNSLRCRWNCGTSLWGTYGGRTTTRACSRRKIHRGRLAYNVQTLKMSTANQLE